MQYGKHHLIILFASFFTLTAYATDPGFYMGVSAGPARNTGKAVNAQAEFPPPDTISVTPSTNQFGARVYMGYKANPYAGFESGFTYFSTIDYKNNSGLPTCGGTTATVRDIDFLGRASLPIRSVEVFGKAGAALTFLTTSKGLNSGSNGQCGETNRDLKVVPEFSIGASYDLSQNWVVDFSYSRLMVGSLVNNMNFYGLGFSYHFVNKYCGQFLCD